MPSGIFLQLEVDFADDEAVARLARYTKPGEARACRDLLVQMWLFCKRKPTDGHVPAEIVGRLAYPDSPRIAERDVGRLVECGVAERTETGYYLTGYLKHNKSLAEIAAAREALAETGSESGSYGNHVRWHEDRGITKRGCPHCTRKSVASPSGSDRVDPTRSDRGESHIDRAIAIDTDRTTDSSQVQKREHRNETLRATDATVRPEDARCNDHTGHVSPPACRGCMAARQYAETAAARARDTAARTRQDCRQCLGTGWIEDEHGNPATKCTHAPRLEVVHG